MKPNDIRTILGALGMAPSKSRGQCFLVDEDVARRQVAMARLGGDEVVLEIGPGLGVLTRLLARESGRVVAVESDARLCDYLRGLKLENVELVRGDALKVELPGFDKAVSNLPYQISSPITFKLLDRPFSLAVLMYQREFAERMVESRGRASSRLSVKLYYKADSELLEVVPASAFHPQPEVEGALVRLVPRPPPFRVGDEGLFFKVVDCIYAHRRKKIGNCLVQGWRAFAPSPSAMRALILGLPFLESRGEELAPEEMGALSDALGERMGRGGASGERKDESPR